eukprot:XP_017947322.1 PREDICTED: E3 ubiquitin-protein ligase MYCBP2-like [Xenopus tropicalis]
MLLPLLIAYIGPVAAAIPKAAVEVFSLVQQLLPSVAILNQKYAPPVFNPNQSTDSTTGNQPEQLSACTTSSHYAVLESEHPYKPASVMQFKVAFPECVRWISVEFDPQCGTAQSEDVLRLMIPGRNFHLSGFGPKFPVHESLNSWVEVKKFSGSTGWPTSVLILPGTGADLRPPSYRPPTSAASLRALLLCTGAAPGENSVSQALRLLTSCSADSGCLHL